MKRKRNSRVRRRDVQKTIYLNTGKNAGKLTSKRKKKASRRQTGFSIAMTSHMQGEAVLTKSVKLLQKLSARQQAKLIKLLNKELIKQSDLVGQKSNELRQKLSEEQ